MRCLAGHRIRTCSRTKSQLVSAILRESLAQKSPVEQRHHRLISPFTTDDLTVSTRCHRLTTLRAPACEPASCCRTMSICTKRQLSYTYLKLSQSKLIKCKNVRNIKENYAQLYHIVVPYHIIVLQSSMQFHDVRYSTDRM